MVDLFERHLPVFFAIVVCCDVVRSIPFCFFGPVRFLFQKCFFELKTILQKSVLHLLWKKLVWWFLCFSSSIGNMRRFYTYNLLGKR